MRPTAKFKQTIHHTYITIYIYGGLDTDFITNLGQYPLIERSTQKTVRGRIDAWANIQFNSSFKYMFREHSIIIRYHSSIISNIGLSFKDIYIYIDFPWLRCGNQNL